MRKEAPCQHVLSSSMMRSCPLRSWTQRAARDGYDAAGMTQPEERQQGDWQSSGPLWKLQRLSYNLADQVSVSGLVIR